MAKSGPRKTNRYSNEFKATAVRLSDLPDVLIQDVADALDIHPFMLSRWRKQAREGLIVTKGVKLDLETTAELKRLRDMEKKYKLLQEEHDLLKKAIRFEFSNGNAIGRPAGNHLRRDTPCDVHP
jgi:transposase